MKDKIIKVWPELLAYLPSVSPLQGISSSNHNIYLDFTGCRQVSSTGLTVFLIRMLKYFTQPQKRRTWRTDNINQNQNFNTVVDLAFFHELNKYAKDGSIFGVETHKTGPFKKFTHRSFYGRQAISFPILCLEFSNYPNNRREPIKHFRKILKHELTNIENEFSVHFGQTNQLISIVTEMAKNSADHTNANAYMGLDIIHKPEDNGFVIYFVFGDMGCGIKRHIEKHLPSETRQARGPHMSLYEGYYYALKHGYTSRPQNKENRGLGMSIILDGSKGIDMELSVFDANSRGFLSSINNNITHEEVRKHFYPFARDFGFYYYGVLEVKPA